MSDMKDLAALVNELETNSQTVEQAIESAERRLKMLRTIKATLGIKTDPKPRAKRQKAEAA